MKGGVLLSIPGEERQVQENSKPVSVDHEEDGQEGLNASLGDNVGVQAVTEIDGVYVVTGRRGRFVSMKLEEGG